MATLNKPFTLISATPSPYARINRIAMIEKDIPFELQSEVLLVPMRFETRID